MAIGGILLGLLYMILQCAVVIFIAWCIVWVFKFFGWAMDPNVYKWGGIIVGLICIIIIVSWLLSLLGGLAPYPHPLPFTR